MSEKIVFVDVETGGLDPRNYPLIQVAAVAVDCDLAEIEALEVKLRFEESVADRKALAINGYDRDVWGREAVMAYDARDRVGDFLARHSTASTVGTRARLAGHNVAFDIGFLDMLWSGLPRPWHRHALCTVSLALWHYAGRPVSERPTSYSLQALVAHLGITQARAHEALSDARASLDIARRLRGVAP